jgi:DNA-binding MarR family transcriptional regulator
MPSKPITIFSDDPEVMALQAMIKGLHHVTKKNLTPRHLKVLMSVELCIKATKVQPTISDLATFAQLPVGSFDRELAELVELTYLVEVVNTYGELEIRYKLGARGGTALRTILDRKAKKKAA